jgi:hypothetical protein
MSIVEGSTDYTGAHYRVLNQAPPESRERSVRHSSSAGPPGQKGKGQRAKGKGQRAKGKGQRAKGKGQRAKGKVSLARSAACSAQAVDTYPMYPPTDPSAQDVWR